MRFSITYDFCEDSPPLTDETLAIAHELASEYQVGFAVGPDGSMHPLNTPEGRRLFLEYTRPVLVN